MKINTKQEDALIVGAETTQFGLNLKDPSVFVQMLINLYSDSVGSSVREYLSNAWDANKESGTDKPIVIGIEKDKFFIQDYGKGMSPEFMTSSEEGYCTIGYSTKRSDNEQLGFYGFGRLTFLSYTNQYWVHTVYEGIAYQYLIFLDGTTIKQTLLETKETDEPSGTRVVVKIKEGWSERQNWVDAIKQQASYFEGTIISGIWNETTKIEVNKDILWKSSINSDSLHFILGCVYYRIDWNQFKKWNFLATVSGGIHIGLDEGIFPTPNRESLVLDSNSVVKLDGKFQKIAEEIYEECEQIISEISDKDIYKLKFIYEGNVGKYSWNLYRQVCSVLGKSVSEIVIPEYKGNENYIFRQIRDSFLIQGYGNQVYSDKWTPLKKDYARSLGFSAFISYNHNYIKTFTHWVKIDTSDIPDEQKRTYEESEANKIKEKLIKEYREEFLTILDESGYEEWKSGRRKKKEKSEGLTYYREHFNDASLCTEDKGTFDLSKYYCLFKANKDNAQKYWNMLRKVYKQMLITKTEGYDLNKLKPSPFLRRMCSEALKSKVYKILGEFTQSKFVLELIKEINPLVHQYILDVKLNEAVDITSDTIEALTESGELLGCFNKDEVKLKFLEHHLNKMVLIKKLGTTGTTWDGNKYISTKQFNQEEKNLIKRFYLLERLVEKKEVQEEVNDLQLELELN